MKNKQILNECRYFMWDWINWLIAFAIIAILLTGGISIIKWEWFWCWEDGLLIVRINFVVTFLITLINASRRSS